MWCLHSSKMENVGKNIIPGLLRFVVNYINHIHMYFVEYVNDNIERFVIDNVDYFLIYVVCINTNVCDLVSLSYFDPL